MANIDNKIFGATRVKFKKLLWCGTEKTAKALNVLMNAEGDLRPL